MRGWIRKRYNVSVPHPSSDTDESHSSMSDNVARRTAFYGVRSTAVIVGFAEDGLV